MYRAGDFITITSGDLQGQTVEITRVRMFATDSGYYAKEIDGLLSPSQVTLAYRRTNGNPCGAACDNRKHTPMLDTCDHCRGTCFCKFTRVNAT